MKKRHLYKLQFCENTNNKCITVTRTDNNYGVQGYVYDDGRITKRYTPYQIPNYIVKECIQMFKEFKKLSKGEQKIYNSIMKNFPETSHGSAYDNSIVGGTNFQFIQK
jgi:hypothetical protein